MVRIAINGFGRIGRLFFRRSFKSLNIIAINSPSNAENIAHLLKYDSVYGKFPGKISFTKDSLTVDGKKIKLFFEREPEKLPWKDLKIDIVAECSGIFRTHDTAKKHLDSGAKKVVLSAPAKDDTQTVVLGVNDKKINLKKDVISNASCTTNCLAPIAKIINDNWKIKKGFMVTVHAYTKDQRVVDSTHKDLRRARSAGINIIPTTSGAATALSRVIPSLKGKFHSSALRVPVACGSVVYLTCEIQKKVSSEVVNNVFKKMAKSEYKGIIDFTDEPLVSSDCIGNSHSAIFDSLLTEVDGDLLKVVAWYDNEFGYACRLNELVKKFGKR